MSLKIIKYLIITPYSEELKQVLQVKKQENVGDSSEFDDYMIYVLLSKSCCYDD